MRDTTSMKLKRRCVAAILAAVLWILAVTVLRSPDGKPTLEEWHSTTNHLDSGAENIGQTNRTVNTKPSKNCLFYQNEILLHHKVEAHAFGVRDSSRDKLCLLTQLSCSRLDRFQRLANNWEGPISAAVYISQNESPEICRQTIGQWLSENDRYNIAVHFVFQNGTLYPINFLRNIAQDHTQAEFIFMVDVDFIPAKSAYSSILSSIESHLFNKRKVLLVVPALELQVNITYPATKDMVKDYYHRSLLNLFHANQFPPAQGPTKFTKWLETQTPYEIHYQTRFEPYVVLKRTDSPRYYERLLQYYHNKSAYTYELYLRGWTFLVIPDAYLVHLPHPYQSSKWLSIYKCVDEELQKFVADIKADVSKQ